MLPFDQKRAIEKLSYHIFLFFFFWKKKKNEDQGIKQFEALNALKPEQVLKALKPEKNQELESMEGLFPKKYKSWWI